MGADERAKFDFEAMVERMPALVWTAKPDGALDYVCPTTCAFFNRTFDQMIEWGWADIVHPDDLPTVGEHWSQSLETGDPYECDFRIRRASDGSFRRFLVRALPARDGSGKIVSWFGLSVDVEDFSGGRVTRNEAPGATG